MTSYQLAYNIARIILHLGGIGTFGFATYYSIKNYCRTGHATQLWLLLSLAMLCGACLSAASLASINGVEAAGKVKLSLLPVFASLLSIAAFISVKHRIKPI